jgi:ubiquitin-activating enzyme E1
MEAMGKLVKMRVVIMGMRGLGVETAKNLILAGPKSVTLVDDTPTKVYDLGANFYLTEDHAKNGVTRAQGSLTKLSELNPYVEVNAVSMADAEALIKTGTINVVCQTELAHDGKALDPNAINKLARSSGAGHICAAGVGPWGFCFVDYGDSHIVNDQDGENTKQFVLSHILNGEKTLVTVHEDKRHSYQEGDYV